MLDALCCRAPEAASARRVAERCMVLLVVDNVERYSSEGETEINAGGKAAEAIPRRDSSAINSLPPKSSR